MSGERTVSVRRIQDADLENIMNWRMKPEVTRYMNTDPKLTLDGQRKWFVKLQSDETVDYWIIVIDGEPAGVINLADLDDPNGQVGWAYYIAVDHLKSFETAISLEMSLYDYVFDHLKKKSIIANVFSANKGVIALHKLCGCEFLEEKKEFIEKNGIKYDMTFQIMTVERWRTIREKMHYQKVKFDV